VKVFRKLEGDAMGRLSMDEYAAARKHPVILMLHNIRSMWNVGSMFRSADAAGIEKIILSRYTETPPRKEIAKTALGADTSMTWEYSDDPQQALRELKKSGVRICGLEIAEGSRPYTEMNAQDFPVCLLVGNEVQGIEDNLLAECDLVLEIPQFGTKHSLNVSVAAGVALFELGRVLCAKE